MHFNNQCLCTICSSARKVCENFSISVFTHGPSYTWNL